LLTIGLQSAQGTDTSKWPSDTQHCYTPLYMPCRPNVFLHHIT